MNIFVVSNDPQLCADRLQLYKRRANKMITETQQLLAFAQVSLDLYPRIRTVGGDFYKVEGNHKNRPCTLWAGKDIKNFTWLVYHLQALHLHYQGDKFQNVRSNLEILFNQCVQLDINLEFVNCAKSDEKNLCFTHIQNVHEAYDLYLKAQGA